MQGLPLLHYRIHKDHPIDHVIGDVQSSVQTRRMTTSYSKLGFKQCKRNYYSSSYKMNKARLVAQGHTQEEGIDYDEVFAPVARIEAIRIFLAYASYLGVTIYQMDVQSCFLIWSNEEEVQQRKKGIFISQDKYVHEILKKFNYTDVKSASTPTDLEKPLVKDADADDVDEHLYRSMIGSLMYLTASRPDIMFAVCACARFQVSPKTSHLLAVKRIFRYLKGKPSLGLWYSKDSPLELVAYTDSDYAGATLDRKSTTGGAAASCCGKFSGSKNQLLDYGYNFMNTIITLTIPNEALASPEQTATGKDFSNPFIVGSLLKTIWLSLHHVFLMKQWLVQSKRLLEKDITPKDRKQSKKMTKPGTEWKSCEGQSQIKAKDQKSQSQSQLNKLTVKTGAVKTDKAGWLELLVENRLDSMWADVGINWGLGHLARNCTVRPRRRDAAYLQTQLLIAQKEEAGIQLQAEEFDLMAAAADLDEIGRQEGELVDQHPATVEETRAI
ncbi:uncharacterized mitochondrial protein-like protein [Tanacetum coccineum]